MGRSKVACKINKCKGFLYQNENDNLTTNHINTCNFIMFHNVARYRDENKADRSEDFKWYLANLSNNKNITSHFHFNLLFNFALNLSFCSKLKQIKLSIISEVQPTLVLQFVIKVQKIKMNYEICKTIQSYMQNSRGISVDCSFQNVSPNNWLIESQS